MNRRNRNICWNEIRIYVFMFILVWSDRNVIEWLINLSPNIFHKFITIFSLPKFMYLNLSRNSVPFVSHGSSSPYLLLTINLLDVHFSPTITLIFSLDFLFFLSRLFQNNVFSGRCEPPKAPPVEFTIRHSRSFPRNERDVKLHNLRWIWFQLIQLLPINFRRGLNFNVSTQYIRSTLIRLLCTKFTRI